MNINGLSDVQIPKVNGAITQQKHVLRGSVQIGAGLLTVALLVVSAVGSTTPAASADGAAVATRSGAIAARPPSRPPTPPNGRILGPPCPEGTVLIMWERPVYDADGLFVVDWELVPTCVPEDLEPAG